MLCKELILFSLFFCLASSSNAQVLNIDRALDTMQLKKLSVLASVDIDLDQQKKDVFDWDAKLDLSSSGKHNQLIALGISEVVYNGKEDILNSGSLQMRYRIGFHKRIHPEPFIQAQWDEVKGMKSRLLAGSNLRFIICDSSRLKIIFATGLFYEEERWGYDGVIDKEHIPANASIIQSNNLKTNFYAKLSRTLSSRSDISFVVFYQARPDRYFFEPRVAVFGQWNVMLNKHFNFALNLGIMADSHPVVPIRHFYYALDNTIGYSF